MFDEHDNYQLGGRTDGQLQSPRELAQPDWMDIQHTTLTVDRFQPPGQPSQPGWLESI